jgi:hypothetical protein
MQLLSMIARGAEERGTESKFLVQDRLRYEKLPQLCFVSLGTVSSFVCERQVKLSGKPGRAGGFCRPKNIRIVAEVHSNPKEVSFFNMMYSLIPLSSRRPHPPRDYTPVWLVALPFALGQSAKSLPSHPSRSRNRRALPKTKSHLKWSASVVCGLILVELAVIASFAVALADVESILVDPKLQTS